jgi:hypothetical protein
VSRRFPLAERKHKKQVAAAAIDSELPKSSAAPIPNDVDLGACVLRKLNEENEASNTSPLQKHFLEVSPNLWPLVVVEEGEHLVAVLPLVPVEAFLEWNKGKAGGRNGKGGGFYHGEAFASALQAIPSVSIAVETSVSIAGILKKEKRKGHGQQGNITAKEMYDRAWQFILDAIPAGILMDTSVSNIEAMFNSPYTQKPMKQPQPFFKPHLFKGRQRIKFMVEENVTGCLGPTPGHSHSNHGELGLCKLTGRIRCCADIENLPDITVPLSIPKDSALDVIVHECTRSYGSIHEQTNVLCFSPPLDWFQLASYMPKGKKEEEGEGSWHLPISCTLEVLITSPSVVQFRALLRCEGVTNKELDYCTLNVKIHLESARLAEVHSSSGAFDQSTRTWNIFTKSKSASKDEWLTSTIHLDKFTSVLELREALRSCLSADLEWRISNRTLTGMRVDTKQISIYPSQNVQVDSSMKSSANVTIMPSIIMN